NFCPITAQDCTATPTLSSRGEMYGVYRILEKKLKEKDMLRFARIFKTFTSIVFIASLLITYAYSIERVDVFINAEKTATMPMESLFFMVLGLFVVLSLLFLLADRFLANYRKNKRFSESILSGERFAAWL